LLEAINIKDSGREYILMRPDIYCCKFKENMADDDTR
jgi:hypothetical protein